MKQNLLVYSGYDRNINEIKNMIKAVLKGNICLGKTGQVEKVAKEEIP